MNDLPERKFVKKSKLRGFKALSDSGYINIQKIFKTVPYRVFEIKTVKNSLKCADNHIVFDENGAEIYSKNLKPKMRIMTENGIEEVVEVIDTGRYENMYDIELDDDNHRYYADGILSHNTTTVTCFILHYILFNFDKKVALLANKGSMAREILSRIQLGYINLPKWMQSGVKAWNKGSIELENGCSIIAAATSSDSVRGSSFSCVTGDTKISLLFDDIPVVSRIDYLALLNKSEYSRYKVATINGYKSFDNIRITNSNIIYHISFSDGSHIKCTPKHRLLLNDETTFIEVSNLKVNDILYSNITATDIKIIHNNTEPVYDLINVEDTQSYYTNNVISHNCIFIDECIGGNSFITVRNKKTGEIKQLTMEEFYNQVD